MTKILILLVVLMCAFGMAVTCFAQERSTAKSFDISVVVPPLGGGLDIKVSKIVPNAADCTGQTDIWPDKTSASETTLSFGQLSWDGVWKIFRAQKYFAVDVGVLDNTSSTWSITHTVESMHSGADTLDDKINVVFTQVQQGSDGKDIVTRIGSKMSLADSSSKYVSKNQFAAGSWFRIYYGIASGVPDGDPKGTGCEADAPGVKPISASTQTGTYSGRVTLTVTS